MKTTKDGYGYGLIQIPFYESIGFGHTGGIDGFSSVYAHFPDQNISFALISNGTNFNSNNIAIAVLSAIYGESYEIPVFTSYDVSSEELDQFIGVYTSDRISLKITFTKKDKILVAEAPGIPASALQAVKKNVFTLDQSAARFVFDPENNTMTLTQGGAEFKFTKE